MKKALALGLAAFLSSNTDAQISQYFFQRQSGVMSEVESYSGALIKNHIVQDDIISPAKVQMPFSFKLGGQVIDTVGIAENGYLFFSSLSAFAVSSPWPISTQHSSQVKGIISPLGIDLYPVNTAAQKTTIKSALVGVAPFRTFIIEWKHASTIDAADSGTPDDINFQIKLYETSGRIEFVYGDFIISPITSVQIEIGLKGSSFNDYTNRIVTTNDWSVSTAGNSQMDRIPLNTNSKPAYGTMYVWEVNPTTGTDDVYQQGQEKVYPVPAKDNLYVTSFTSNDKCSFTIRNLSGIVLFMGTIQNNCIDISGLASGHYLLQIESSGSSQVIRFIKK